MLGHARSAASIPRVDSVFLCAMKGNSAIITRFSLIFESPFWWGMHIEKLIGLAYGRDKTGREAALELFLHPAPQPLNERNIDICQKRC